MGDASAPEGATVIPANAAWVDTGVIVKEGEPVSISAGGRIIVSPDIRTRQDETSVGPAGTFHFSDDISEQTFPLPGGGRGPAPCYALIGRIDDGPCFFVGERKSWVADRSGRLWLGVNDYDVSDNRGQFHAEITKPQILQPVGYQEVVATDTEVGTPTPESSVVVIYVDGLRPDVVREMAAMGHIPNIKTLFLEGGAWMNNAFTAFPSDTITSNGTMWTGCFSDRHGLKGQVRFSRHRLVSESYLDPLGPNRSSRLLKPQGIDQVVRQAQAASIRTFKGEAESQQWQQTTSTDIPPLYAHLRDNGTDWATGILPMMTEVPPLLWTRSMARHMPFFNSQDAWKYVDDANTHFAVRQLIPRNKPVTIIWLPETDSVSHKLCRGQFGMTRRTIAQADLLIGQIVNELNAQDRYRNTYLILVSDHGHHGGQKSHLMHFDIANHLFYQPREVTTDGRWVGGGLGLSVRQHRAWNRHQEDGRREFVFVDGDSDGAARVFFPRQSYRSNDWSGPNSPGQLLNYQLSTHLPAVNLVEAVLSARAVNGRGVVESPIDLVLMKLTDDSILISTADRGKAIVHRRRNDKGDFVYKYTPVTNLQPTTDGRVVYQPVDYPQRDPLGLLKYLQPEVLKYYYDEKAWLQGTLRSDYPDSIVTLTRHMLWQENLRAREQEYAPDLVVTARSGWYFGTQSSPGTMHGYPLADAMHASWFVHGPNVRRGTRVETPCRLVDLTPTILQMIGVETPEGTFDGSPVTNIYQPAIQQTARVSQPVYWQDVDLQAWKSLNYAPVTAYAQQPRTINHPSSPYDLNNMAYNVLSVGELSVFRLFDDVLSPLTDGTQPIAAKIDEVDQRVRRSRKHWVVEGAQALNIPEATVGDYSFTSLGNLKRVDGVIDWAQERTQNLDAKISAPAGRTHTPGSRTIHKAIDSSQLAFWEVYRFAQRVAIEILDETLLSGIENGTDKMLNAFNRLPDEVIVDDPGNAHIVSEPIEQGDTVDTTDAHTRENGGTRESTIDASPQQAAAVSLDHPAMN